MKQAMRIETEFRKWLKKQDTKFLNESASGTIFKRFMNIFLEANYSDISLIINDEERERKQSTPIKQDQ